MLKADNNVIKQIRFLRKIYTCNWYGCSGEYEADGSRLLYKVTTHNGQKFVVDYNQISEIVGKEDWFTGEFNTLANIGSHRTVTLSWGCKRKDSSKSNGPDSSLCVGDVVNVLNHGTKWTHTAKIVSIDNSTSSAVVKWHSTGRKDRVNLTDCVKWDQHGTSNRKRTPTDFFQHVPTKKQKSNASLTTASDQMKNMFYSKDNCLKLCAEGAIRNLMNMLHCSVEDMNTFWDLATLPLPLLLTRLNVNCVPDAVIGKETGINSINKCLWILRLKFKFATTTRIKVSRFQSLKETLKALLAIQFPMLISVESRNATYNHVVVVWKKMVIDFETKHTFTLTEESLREVCGTHTTFLRLTSGYGIFPSRKIRLSKENSDVVDWGMNEYYKVGGNVRNYFMSKK